MKSEGSQIIRKEKGEDSKIIIIMEKKKKNRGSRNCKSGALGKKILKGKRHLKDGCGIETDLKGKIKSKL